MGVVAVWRSDGDLVRAAARLTSGGQETPRPGMAAFAICSTLCRCEQGNGGRWLAAAGQSRQSVNMWMGSAEEQSGTAQAGGMPAEMTPARAKTPGTGQEPC